MLCCAAAGVWGTGSGGSGGGGGGTAPSSILDPNTGLLKTEKYRTSSTNTTFQIAPFTTDRDSAENVCKNNGGSLAAYASQQEQVRPPALRCAASSVHQEPLCCIVISRHAHGTAAVAARRPRWSSSTSTRAT